MAHIFIARHGETEWNQRGLCQGREDLSLDEEGKKQALALGKKLLVSGIHFDAFFSSPLKRAQQTLQIILSVIAPEAKYLIEASFIERDFGAIEGSDVVAARKISMDESQWRKVKGYEPDEEVGKRMLSGFLKIGQAYPDKNVLIISHSHAIKSLLHLIYPEKYSYNLIFPNSEAAEFFSDGKKVELINLKLF